MPTHGHAPSPAGDGLHESDSGLAALLPSGEKWREGALCAQIGGDLWFPEKGGSTREAKRICNGTPGREPCPVREECLRFALDHDERFGVFGGLSERERSRLRTAGRPAVAAPAASRQRASGAAAPRPARERRPVGIDHGTEPGLKAHKRLGERPCVSCEHATDPVPAPVVERERPGVTRPWTAAELARAVRLLTDYGMTPAEIAAEIHVPTGRVRRALRPMRGAA